MKFLTETTEILDRMIAVFAAKLEDTMVGHGVVDPAAIANICAAIESLANARVALVGKPDAPPDNVRTIKG